LLLLVGHHADDRATFDLRLGVGLVCQCIAQRSQGLTAQLQLFAALQSHLDLLGIRLDHHGRLDVAAGGVVFQGFSDQGVPFAGVRGQGHVTLGAAPRLAAIEVQQAAPQRVVRRGLFPQAHRGVNIQASGVGIGTIALEHQQASRFSHIPGLIGQRVLSTIGQGLFSGLVSLIGSDETVLQHPIQDVQLTNGGPFGVADGVVGRGCFG